MSRDKREWKAIEVVMSTTNSTPAVSGSLPLPASFPFPFPAYSIQEDFMKALFRCLDEAHFGIFESPTGTGKSLSLICGALTWFHAYEDHRRAALRERINLLAASTASDDGDGDDWFSAAVKRNEEKGELAKLRQEMADLEEKEQRIADLRRRRKAHRVEGVRKVMKCNNIELIDEVEVLDLFACKTGGAGVRRPFPGHGRCPEGCEEGAGGQRRERVVRRRGKGVLARDFRP